MPNQGASWRERRTHDAAGQVRRLAERQAAETAQARVLIAGFLEAAEHAGITPEPLFARGYGNRGRYRTGLTGWYLRVNESAALDTEGNFYVMTVAGGLRTKLFGATPEPSDPPLILGKGARDGESIDLQEALERVLARRTQPS
ncbi:MAG: hypothetical protein GX593_06000 [Actinomycetales bacterium]|nr:hypothetical protein [Actinomycetales bacterium]